jgi:hypothetical protein
MAESEIDDVPVSDNNIRRRMDDLSHDVEDVLSEILINANFALQFDESTGITIKLGCWRDFKTKVISWNIFGVKNCR